MHLRCFSNLTLNTFYFRHLNRADSRIPSERRTQYARDMKSEAQNWHCIGVERRRKRIKKRKKNININCMYLRLLHLMGPRCRHSVMWNSFMCTFVAAVVVRSLALRTCTPSATTCVSLLHRERETVCAEHSAEQKDYTIQMMQDFGSLFTIHKIQIIIVKLGVNIDVHWGI